MNNQEQTQIGKLNVARTALAEAKTIEEIIKLDNLGEAISYYAKKEKLSGSLFGKKAEFTFGDDEYFSIDDLISSVLASIKV